MKHWKRIFWVFFILVGSTSIFAYYSFNQFNNALDDLSASSLSIANISSTSFSDKRDRGQTLTATLKTVSASASEAISTPTTSTDPEPSFVFPKINGKVYTGCTYKLSFQSLIQSSTATHSLETALIDAGTKETIDPSESGLARENKIKLDFQSLDWKVGIIWPGKYYIKLLNTIGIDPGKIRSNVFTISGTPKSISIDEKKKICQESDGSF